MILDAYELFSNEQAVTATAASTDYKDLQDVRDIGPGEPVKIGVWITTAFNTLTSLAFELQVDDNTGFSSATVLATVSLTLAQLTLGRHFELTIPPHRTIPGGERYMRLRYVVTGTNPTLGKVTAGIMQGSQQSHHYQGFSFTGL